MLSRSYAWKHWHNVITINGLCIYVQGLGGAVCLWMDMLSPEIAAPFPGYEL